MNRGTREPIATYIGVIRAAISTPALCEQLAEECVELAHAALKYARFMRNENPTPAKGPDIVANLLEEISDVHLVSRVLELESNPATVYLKAERWADRIKAKENIHE